MNKTTLKEIKHSAMEIIDWQRKEKPSKWKAGEALASYNELKQKASPELLKLIEEHLDGAADDLASDMEFFFFEGFKLGLLMGLECCEK